MFVKKIGKEVFGTVLTKDEKKGLDIELKKELAEYDQKHAAELDAFILWELHTQLGFGKKRLKRFFDKFDPAMQTMIEHYCMNGSDREWLCTEKLKEIGVDINQWNDESGKVTDSER